MGRPNDILIPPDTSWLNDPAARKLCQAMGDAGFQILFVGGCVRNALLGLADSDIDMSTNALPDQVSAIAENAGFKAIPTGIDHGTITVVVDGAGFEVTTFRRDVATDGRRAVVAFSHSIEDDARRRDFTMNALYADIGGNVFDPLGGVQDLLARRVKFIEDPDARIKEDYLRILRFFRFSAWYADAHNGFDAIALAAISTNTDGLETLSAERVGQEMWKLLAAPDPSKALATMRQVNVLATIMPGADDRMIGVLVHMEDVLGLSPDPVSRLTLLGGDDPTQKLRLSKNQSRALAVLKEAAFEGPSIAEIAYRHGEQTARAVVAIRATIAEVEPEFGQLKTISSAAAAKFPVAASDLMPNYAGAALGLKLKELEQRWIESHFRLTAAELLDNG
ncbi:tRNA nucleotidyltransferase [Sulfitobacter noctilucicola]|uniref:Poly(A) polymerase/tRNA nucleotidyltransferase (CCA-adding enzyme) n=1 Tax=Sulfitobacter noctilucicola TaxID=1342301 RepID=A0A7W6M5W5_9RHOB|nr:CCA tRNA nucleotidyltransferase [Sulfitobacter noctilucicola]KIN62801.1 tRNA nucleotidyltransferase [Sulfitobacter noctilucicola]MBB4172668.1 poly(A) polymerase/tRNA nucleotidyltransferase (CCA-adding enzyme) [Sulfitobacter noctilucicola]